MILGLGLDTIDIRRIEKTLERFGTRFTERVFTETERRKADGRATRAATWTIWPMSTQSCAVNDNGVRRSSKWLSTCLDCGIGACSAR